MPRGPDSQLKEVRKRVSISGQPMEPTADRVWKKGGRIEEENGRRGGRREPTGTLSGGVEFVVRQEGGDRRWSLLREAPGLEGGGGEGVGAMVDHGLGEVADVGGSLDPEIAKHGVRLPAAEEGDGVGVDPSTEEGSGSAGTEGACREQVGGNACDGIEKVCGVLESAGDV